MKAFDLDAAKNGAKVVTRNNLPVRILCFDRKNSMDFPIVALVMTNEDEPRERVCLYNEEGVNINFRDEDLFMASVIHNGWVNIYVRDGRTMTGLVFSSKEEAEAAAKDSPGYISTVPVEWEE